MIYFLNMWSCVLIFLHYGFSLDTSNLQQSSGGQNKQYLTVSEFIDESYHQQRQLQRKFTLLASQLTLKLAALEQKINEKGVKKEICKESVQLQENINELAKNYTKLQHDFEVLHEKYIAQNEELKLFRNKTNERDTEITIQPLQDCYALQKEVQSISKQTRAFSLTQNARSEDLQSLYNETKGEIANLAAELQNFQNARSKDIQSLYNETKGEIANLAAELQNFQNARSKDIQSLYNESKGELVNLAAELQNFQNARSKDIQSLYNETKGEIANLAAELQNFQNARSKDMQSLYNETKGEIANLAAELQNFQNARSKDIQSLYNETNGEIANFAAELHNFQNARSKDIQSLYNETNGEITNLAAELQNFQSNQNLTLADLERKMHLTISSLDAKFQNNLQSSENSLKSSLTVLHQLVDRSNERVALLSNRVHGSGAIILFNVHHSYGITNSTLSMFKSTGTFVCEKEGLYLIASNIISNKSGSWFKIMKNQEELSRTYIAQFGSGASWHSGTGIVVVTLQIMDTIYIGAGGNIGSSSHENTLIIIKIK